MTKPTYILIVDDVQKMASSLSKALKKLNDDWILLEAHSIDEALSVIRTVQLDAVVTDWVLNEHNKSETAIHVIRAARLKDPTCVTIVFTGHQGDFDRYKEAYAEGAFDVISKAQQGVVLAKEVTVKLKAALDRRELFLRASTYARHIDHKLQEKYGLVLEEKTLTRRWVTIMFTDIRGFSAVTDKLKAHQAVITDFLAELYGVLVDCAHRHGGIVDKFIGDGSMVLFGVLEATTANDQSTDLSAVQAALDMQTACEPLIDILQAKASELEAVQMPELALGIGINRAEVFVGIIGTKHRDQFTAIGHGVNLAARYESAACKRYEKGKGNYGKILLSSTVQHHVAKHFNLKKEPSLTNIRNIGDPHPVWSVESKKNRPG